MAKVLLDSSFLVSLGYIKDKHHQLSGKYIFNQRDVLLIPDVVLVEAMYNLRRLGGNLLAISVAEALSKFPPNLVGLTNLDFDRSIALMRQYKDADLDFVDCCITAMAERLNITSIATYDRRDFSMIRPNHVEYFELVP